MNKFQCDFDKKEYVIEQLAGIIREQNEKDDEGLNICANCLKKWVDEANKVKPVFKPSKEKLERELKDLEQVGLEQYLENSKQVYLNQIEFKKKQIKEYEQ